MAWSNITIPNRFSTITQCHDKIAELEFKVQRLNHKLDSYEKEFDNIYRAAKEFKKITLIPSDLQETITLKLEEK